jgi:hypothetical protein
MMLFLLCLLVRLGAAQELCEVLSFLGRCVNNANECQGLAVDPMFSPCSSMRACCLPGNCRQTVPAGVQAAGFCRTNDSQCLGPKLAVAASTGCEGFVPLSPQTFECCVAGAPPVKNLAPACGETVPFDVFDFVREANTVFDWGEPAVLKIDAAPGQSSARLVFPLPTAEYLIALRPACEADGVGPYTVAIGAASFAPVQCAAGCTAVACDGPPLVVANSALVPSGATIRVRSSSTNATYLGRWSSLAFTRICTPAPTPVAGSPCNTYTSCAQCINMALTQRSCRFCGSACQESASVCFVMPSIIGGGVCPTPAPTPVPTPTAANSPTTATTKASTIAAVTTTSTSPTAIDTTTASTIAATTTATTATTTTPTSATAIGATTSTTSAQSSVTPTTADLASTNMVASTSTPMDNTPLIAGAVGGSLLFLAFVALVAFLVRRHKSAPVVARASQPSELRSANEYQAVRVNPPSAAYDVGQIERPREDDYSQLQIKPPSNSNYDVVDAEEPRYADPSILAPDSGPATRGIVARNTGVGTNYGRL